MKLTDLLKKKPVIDRAAKPDAAKEPVGPRQP